MYAVIIVAGGIGSRMNAELPKQLLELNNKPLIVYSIEKFLQFDKSIQVIVALHKNYFEAFEKIKSNYNLPMVQVVQGGETRYQSVKNALNVLNLCVKLVAVHDAARPLVSLQTIQLTMAAARHGGAAIPVIKINESLREEYGNNKSKAVDRTKFKIVQTPQCFKKEVLLNAFQLPYNSSFTDDATLVEQTGQTITLTEGNRENIKITYPQDLIIAQALLSK